MDFGFAELGGGAQNYSFPGFFADTNGDKDSAVADAGIYSDFEVGASRKRCDIAGNGRFLH